MTGNTYKECFDIFLLLTLRGFPLSMILQNDTARRYYADEARNYLKTKLSGRQIGRDGPISWPSRSTDLTPYEYFLKRKLKEIVYRDSPRTIEELKTKIRCAIQAINEDTLQLVFENIKLRLNFVVREQGGPFEHLISKWGAPMRPFNAFTILIQVIQWGERYGSL